MKNKLSPTQHIALFQKKSVRRAWHNSQWFFSVIDVITILTGSTIPRRYWSDLKKKLKQEGSEVYEKIVQLKMIAADGKSYTTDVFAVADILRVVQSIPSPKAEPLKQWLARVGKERIDEIQNPELAVNRAKSIYEQKGYSEDWVSKRMRGIAVRNTLTDEWRQRSVQGIEYAILTNEIYQTAFDMNAEEYKQYKVLHPEHNLRDHMDDIELIITMLGEATTTKLTQERDSKVLRKLKQDAHDGGAVAGRTRQDIEKQTGKKVARKENFLPTIYSSKLTAKKSKKSYDEQ